MRTALNIDESAELAADRGDSELGLRAWVDILLSHKWLILGCTLLCGVAAFLWTSRQVRMYQATAIIEYDPYPVRPLGREVEDVADPIGNYWRTQEFFQTQNHILQSRSMAERVVRRLSLHEDPGFFGVPPDEHSRFRTRSIEAAAGRLKARVGVSPVSNTRLVEVSVRDADPERAQLLVNTLVEEYVDKTVEDRLGSTVEALEWLGAQLESLRGELNDAELALHHFKEEHHVLSVSLEDQRNLVSQEIQHFSNALSDARSRRIALSARTSVLQEASEGDPLTFAGPLGEEDSELHTLRARIREKQASRDRLAVRYGPNHPDLQELNAELETLQAQLRQEVDRTVEGVSAQLRSVRNAEAGLREALAEAQEAGLNLNLREIEYTRLQRERANKAQVYELVLQRATEADLTRMLRTTHVRPVDLALVPQSPVYPSYRQNVGGGLAAGLVLGIALAFLLSRLDRRLRSAEQIEALGVSVLGVIPAIEPEDTTPSANAKRKRRRKRKRDREDAPHGPERDLWVHRYPASRVAESCRSIRTNLTFMSVDQPKRTLVVTSGSPKEGKTTATTSLAISLAQSGKRVLLVDTDLRQPQLHKAFGIEAGVGVTNVLAGERTLDSAIRKTEVPGLYVLPAGPIPPNPAELFHSRHFAALIDEASETFDMTIFDSPPANVVTDAAVIAPQVDGTLLVVRGGSTTRDSLKASLRQLKDLSADVLGVLLNSVDVADQGRYGGKYTAYYAYGADVREPPADAAE